MSRSTTTTARRASGPRPPFQCAFVLGTVHGPVVVGHAADGAPLVSFDVVVVGDDGRALVPVSGRDLGELALAEGDTVAVRGRLAKRFHRAGGRVVARTALEVDELMVAPSRAALARLVARAGAALEAGGRDAS